MKREKFNALQRGDLIQFVGPGVPLNTATNGERFLVVDSNGRGRVTVARTAEIGNPEEWERVPDEDDPRFAKPSTPEPEAGLTMGEPESTPGTWKLSTPVGFPVEVPADCAGAGVLHIPNRCSKEYTPENVRLDPQWVAEADAILKRNAESRTSTTISQTTTTSPAEPLARAILASPTNSASNDDVRRVAHCLELAVSAGRSTQSHSDAFAKLRAEPWFQQPASVVSRGYGANLEFVPVESYDDYVKHVLDPARGSYSRPFGFDSWAYWNNARVVRTPAGPVPRAIVTDNGTRGRYFPDDLEQQVAEAEQQHKVVGRFVDGRFVATEDSTPVEPDALDRLNDELDDLELERELTGNTTTTSTTTTTEPAVRLGRRAFDALRGPFDASAVIPTGPESFFLDDVRQLPDGRLYSFRYVRHHSNAETVAILRDLHDAGALPTVPVATWRDATPVRSLLEFGLDVSARPDEPFDCWIWSPVLETWVVGCGNVILVGAEQ